MVDTTIAPISRIEPPFSDPVADKATPDVHSQPWNDFLTKQADRVADTYQRMAAAEANITTLQAKMGVTDGSDATAGQIGEYVSNHAPSVPLVSNVDTNLVSLNLTAGDWEVRANVIFTTGTGAHTLFGCGFGGISSQIWATFPASGVAQGMAPVVTRASSAGPMTAWLVGKVVSTSATIVADATIEARRVR